MIITVDPDRSFGDRVANALSGSRWAGDVRHTSTTVEVIDVFRGPAVVQAVVVGPGVGIQEASTIADHAASTKGAPAVVIVAEPTTATLRTAMRAGARDVLAPSFTADELVDVLTEAGVASSGPAPLPGLTVAVFATKGGVGTSVVASNLAILMAQRSASLVTLLDLDLASADQAIMHGIAAQYTIQELADGEIGRDHESLRQVLRPIADTGARLLPGPLDPALAETITAPDVAEVIATARSEAPYVVLDTSSSFDDRTLAAIDAADVLVVVTSMDVGALRALSVSLQTFKRLGVSCPIRVAVMRADSKTGMNVGDIERAIGRDVDIRIPSHRAVPRSVNEGVPLALSTPRSGVVQAIDALAEDLLSLAPPVLPGAAAGDPAAVGRRALRRRPVPEAGSSADVPPTLPHPAVGGDVPAPVPDATPRAPELRRPVADTGAAVRHATPAEDGPSPKSDDEAVVAEDESGDVVEPTLHVVNDASEVSAPSVDDGVSPPRDADASGDGVVDPADLVDQDRADDEEGVDPRRHDLTLLPPPTIPRDGDDDDDEGRRRRRHARRR